MAENPEQGNGSSTTIGVVKETAPGETRVGLIPDSVKHLVGKGMNVVVEAGAGNGSSISDEEYTAQGATIAQSSADVYAQSDVVIRVQAPSEDRGELSELKDGQVLVSFLAPLVNHDLNRKLADTGVTAMAVDAVPRITRAQSMDALSAMSTIGGYKAVLLAADRLPKFFPLLMTAAGTIRPAKVLVLGAGVAGLQAIATARRLGAVVDAYDVRAVVKEQVESLGAKFVSIDTGADAEAAGGYAREATPEELKKQQEGLNEYIANADVVITTALVPGRPAPKMIPAEAVERMRHGSVIVDLAAETGGNCELTTPGEITTEHGVTIVGLLNLPAHLPVHASQMYGKVVTNFLDLLVKDGQVNLNFEDEIIKGMCITNSGEIVQDQTRKMMGLEELEAPEPVAPAEASTEAEVDGDGDSDHEDADIHTVSDFVDEVESEGEAVESDIPDDIEEPLVGDDPAEPVFEEGDGAIETDGASSSGDFRWNKASTNIPSAPPPAHKQSDDVIPSVDTNVLADVSADENVVYVDDDESAEDAEESVSASESHGFDAEDVYTEASETSESKSDDDSSSSSSGPDDLAAYSEEQDTESSDASGESSSDTDSHSDSTAGSADSEPAAKRSSKLPASGEGEEWLPGDGTRNVPEGFPIKGNADSGLYHPPASHSYTNTIAEIYFANVEAAEAHGYTLPKSLRDVAKELGKEALNSLNEEKNSDG